MTDVAKQTFLAVLVTGFVVCSVSPAYPSLFSRANLTPSEERELGEEFMVFVKKRFTLIEDPAIVGYVKKVGQRIVEQLPSPPFDFQFYVVEQDVYNAFAGPGGHIIMYSGLIAAMESEEELAGILTHEISHVVCRHISKQMEQSRKIGLATMAGILAGIFLGGSAATTSAITSGSLAAGQSLSLQYSREHEIQADQVGLKYLTKAGYGGTGLLKILEKMRKKQWFGSDQIPSYMSTHPAVEDRIVYLDTWIQAHPEWNPPTPRETSGDFHKVRTKLIALHGDAVTAHKTFDAALKKNDQDALALYGKGLVLDRAGKRQQATEYLEKAVQLRPLDPDILRDLGKTLFHLGEYDKALKTLKGALAFNQEDSEGRLLLGRTQMMTENLQGALETFQELLKGRPDYLPATYYLGETFGKLGNLPEAHYHLGIHYKGKGLFKNAGFHLKRALKLFAGNPAREERIREALKELSTQEKSEKRKR